MSKAIPLEPGVYYHIYNRANGDELLFRNEDNYHYFLERFEFLITPIAHTYAYCLMPNHFHFLLNVKTTNEISHLFHQKKRDRKAEFSVEDSVCSFNIYSMQKFISQQFSNLFNGYTQAFNKQHKRKGSLFMPSYKRKVKEREEYLIQLIMYIHLNPLQAGLSETLSGWKFSSYNSFVTIQPTGVQKDEVLKWFGGLESFKKMHQEQFLKNN